MAYNNLSSINQRSHINTPFMTAEKVTILADKNFEAPSVFLPQNLLREARRQKGIAFGDIPRICVLDPDGDIVEYLKNHNLTTLHPHWACYHTDLYQASCQNLNFGIIGCAVGASFAVLLAEQLFASGCELLISITSAGTVNQPSGDCRFILIDSALRDEGTSYHYLPPTQPAILDPLLKSMLTQSFSNLSISVQAGKSWTTDAPYRETLTSIQAAKDQGAISVEMEAAALYAFAIAQQRRVVCYAHLTNTMAQDGEDFEKGLENGSIDSLQLILHTAATLLRD